MVKPELVGLAPGFALRSQILLILCPFGNGKKEYKAQREQRPMAVGRSPDPASSPGIMMDAAFATGTPLASELQCVASIPQGSLTLLCPLGSSCSLALCSSYLPPGPAQLLPPPHKAAASWRWDLCLHPTIRDNPHWVRKQTRLLCRAACLCLVRATDIPQSYR